MGTEVSYGSLPFEEAIGFFRSKVNIPTERWTDLWQGMHARGFMVAGAAKADLLSDFRAAVDKAIAGQSTLADFRKDFDAIVAKHGWSYKGSRGWRSSVIYQTNVRTAYMAGRYAQMTHPDVLASRPYWQYRHGDSVHPRPLHLSWNGLVLRADDAWWQSHYPPNGWGCKCKVFALSGDDLAARGKSKPDTAPDNGTYRWTDKVTGEVHDVPNGIDPGWAYNVGESAWGRPMAKQIIDAQLGGKWADQGGNGPFYFGRPDTVPADVPRASLGPAAGSVSEMRQALRAAIGGEEKAFKDPFGDYVLVNQAIADHIAALPKRLDGRERYFPFIGEAIEDPYEIWVAFARNELTGQVSLRRRYVKVLQMDKERVIGLVANTVNGVWIGFDVFRGKPSALKNLRKGQLVWGRE